MAHNVLITPASGKIEWADHSTGSTHVGTPDFTLQNCDDSLQLTSSGWSMHPQNLAHANVPTGTSTGSLYSRTDDGGHLYWLTNDSSSAAAGGAINQNISCRDCLHGHGEEIVLADGYLCNFYGCCNADYCVDFGGTLEWCQIAELKIYIHHGGRTFSGWGPAHTCKHYMFGRRYGRICYNTTGSTPAGDAYDCRNLCGDEYSLQFYSSDTSSNRNIDGGSGDARVCCAHNFLHTQGYWPNQCDTIYEDVTANKILVSSATVRLHQPSDTTTDGYSQTTAASTFNIYCTSGSKEWDETDGYVSQVFYTAYARSNHCQADVTLFRHPEFNSNKLCWYMPQDSRCTSRFKIHTGQFDQYNSIGGDGVGTTILCVRYNCCHFWCGINNTANPDINTAAICFNGFLSIHSTYYGGPITMSSTAGYGSYPTKGTYAPGRQDSFTTLWSNSNAICGLQFQLPVSFSNACKIVSLNGWTRVTVTYLPWTLTGALGLGKNEVFV